LKSPIEQEASISANLLFAPHQENYITFGLFSWIKFIIIIWFVFFLTNFLFPLKRRL
jgi:hypothetical protein